MNWIFIFIMVFLLSGCSSPKAAEEVTALEDNISIVYSYSSHMFVSTDPEIVGIVTNMFEAADFVETDEVTKILDSVRVAVCDNHFFVDRDNVILIDGGSYVDATESVLFDELYSLWEKSWNEEMKK